MIRPKAWSYGLQYCTVINVRKPSGLFRWGKGIGGKDGGLWGLEGEWLADTDEVKNSEPPDIRVWGNRRFHAKKKNLSETLPSPGFLVRGLASFHSWLFSVLCWILYVNIPAEAPGDVFSHLSCYPSPRRKKKPSVQRLSSVRAGLAFGWDTGCPCVRGLAPGASSWVSGGSLCLQPPKAGGESAVSFECVWVLSKRSAESPLVTTSAQKLVTHLGAEEASQV